MRKRLVLFGTLSVLLLASAGTLARPEEEGASSSIEVPQNAPDDADRHQRIVAALEDGFPPALIRDLDTLVRDGEIPADLVMRAKADADKSRVQTLLKEIRAGSLDPRSEDRAIRDVLDAGLTTGEAVGRAWREGSAERAQALMESLRAPATIQSARDEVNPALGPGEIEATLKDAEWSAAAIADAKKIWKDRRAGQTLGLLHSGIYVLNWLDHLQWGLERGLYSVDYVTDALVAAGRKEMASLSREPGGPPDLLVFSTRRAGDSWRLHQSQGSPDAHTRSSSNR